ncbi:hypothetical protein Dsin_004442 [Dipteronia sinensis]|uniref:RNase H type-1 domain-containing protein n=1 Tax=Dipteronia sinensis TaxID=43782 RepID=A0AAE0AVL7_9ROSI|nr:hypothetical protein Dsin_004442 [Dipteronia sinensis]
MELSQTLDGSSFVSFYCRCFLSDFREANSGTTHGFVVNHLVAESWRPPDLDQTKINTDAALDSVKRKVRLGDIIRNSRGDVLGSRSCLLMAKHSHEVAEGLAILHGLVFAHEVGLLPFAVETDAQVAVGLSLLLEL